MKNRSAAFTLIELLVVVSIIALLMAILLPSLQRAGKQAKSVACQMNLHDWGLLLCSLAQANEGRVADVNACPACRTQQFAYYIDNFSQQVFCPMAVRRTGPSGIGSSYQAWFCPVHPYRAGSYGINGWSPAYILTTSTSRSRSESTTYPLSQRWPTIDQKGASNIPLMLDSAIYASHPLSAFDSPPQRPDEFSSGGMKYFCIDRHNGFVNGVFMDMSLKKVGLKELWALKWHRQFDISGPWTRAGGVHPNDWPPWMRRFKGY